MATIVLTVNGASSTKTISTADAARVLTAYGNPRGISTTQGMADALLKDLTDNLKSLVVGYEKELNAPSPPVIT